MSYRPYPFYNDCAVELGANYNLATNFGLIRNLVLVKVTRKGFNFLNTKTSKMFFKRPVYQVKSAFKKIKRGQKIFILRFPGYINQIIDTLGSSVQKCPEVDTIDTMDTENLTV